MPLRPRWKIEVERLAKESIAIAQAALREFGTPRYFELLATSTAIAEQAKELQDANKPPPKNPLLESFAKFKGFMPPPAVLHAFDKSTANSSSAAPSQPATISTEQVSGEG
eukprot:5550989-Pleurochrysis_carterae.AAC.1